MPANYRFPHNASENGPSHRKLIRFLSAILSCCNNQTGRSRQLISAVISNQTKDTIISSADIRCVEKRTVIYAVHAAGNLGPETAVVLLPVKEADRVVVKSANSGIDCYLARPTQSTLMKLGSSTANPDISTLSIAATAGQHEVGEIKDNHARPAMYGSGLQDD